MPCPTCGAVHTPGTPHQPLQTMAQRPPPPPALEEDRPPPPAADPADSADAGDSQRDDDEPSAKGIARRENGPFAGKTNGSGAAQISRKTPPTGAGRRNGRTGAATARPIMGVQGTRLPPPPAGSPADTWDHYLRILPPGELAQRQSAREEINRTILDAGSREAQVAAGARYAHTDAEKEFLQYTGVLPTLDAEVDAGIRERETRRRASVRARRAAREAYQEARQTYRERFLAYTGQEPTFDTKQDTAVLDGEYTRRKEAVSEWGEQGNALADTFWTESQGRLDSRGGDLGTVDLHADPRYQQWLKSEPAFTVLPDGTGGVDNSDYKQFLRRLLRPA